MTRSNGGIIGPEILPENNMASGIWSLSDQQQKTTTWPIPTILVEFLIIGGGGGGAYNNFFGTAGSGGGAIASSITQLKKNTVVYPIVVGAGGPSRLPSSYQSATAGNSSSAFDNTSGGGIPSPTLNQLNFSESGTPQSFKSSNNGAGAGGDATFELAGPGFLSNITGTDYRYAAGGARPDQPGGIDGGGDGPTSTTVGQNGTPNTGGGGGSGSHQFIKASGAGGSGVVILRTLETATATTGSPTVAQDGNHNIYTFTGSGSITF